MSGLSIGGLDLVGDVEQLLSYHFMLNALRAGTIVAVLAGAIGYFMVLRRQSFAGHTLAVIGFPGAAGATWLGLSASLGYYGFCLAGALAIAALPAAGRLTAGLGGYGDESAVIGTVQAVALACGFLFVSLYKGFLNGLTGLLFGSITGVSDGQVLALLVAGTGCLLVLLALGRPLLFSSIDSDVARARGVPVRLVGTAFLLVLAVAAAGASQITGSLLVFALLVTPAATASRLTARPAAGAAAIGADRGGGDLARRGDRLLLAVPDRFLGDHAGLLLVPAGDRLPPRHRPAGAAAHRPHPAAEVAA